MKVINFLVMTTVAFIVGGILYVVLAPLVGQGWAWAGCAAVGALIGIWWPQ